MLSRVAENLYWMGRYLERAESMASMVGTHLQMILDIPSEQSRRLSRDWSPLLDALGMLGSYRQLSGDTGREEVSRRLLFERRLESSVAACLALARENALTVREQITPEMWEQINRIYLWGTGQGAREHYQRNAYEFFQRLAKSLQLFQGIVDAMMLRGDGWDFLQLGKHLERADKVSRWLDERYHLFQGAEEPRTEMSGWSEFMTRDELEAADTTDADRTYYNWMAALRICQARSTYQRLYPSRVEPVGVSELLLLNEQFPGSMLFCVSSVERALRRISRAASGRFSSQSEKLSGRLASRLRYASIEEIHRAGLSHTVSEAQVLIHDIGEALLEDCIHPPLAQPATPPLHPR